MSVLRYTDMDRPCLGEIYDGIDSMLEKIKQIVNEKEQDTQETFFKQLQAIVVERWNKMTTPLHLLAYALTPNYYSTQFTDQPGRLPPYRDVEVCDGYKVASSSASKRNWSTFSFIHSVKRNRLQSKRAENLVFVHHNLRLVSHKNKEYKEGETKKWDVNAEFVDLDASTSRLALDEFEDFDANTIIVAADPIGLSSIAESTNVEEDEDEDEDEEEY